MGESLDRRKPGRPRTDDPGSKVSTWVSQKEHDRLIRLAQARGESVSATVRQLLQRKLA